MWYGPPRLAQGKVAGAICHSIHENLRKIDERLPNVINQDHQWWKMTPASYDDAVRYVRRQSRISTNSLADGLGIRWSLALDFLEEMKRKGMVGDMQDNGWWPVLRKETFSPPRKPTAAPAQKAVTPANSAPAALERMEGQAAAASFNHANNDPVQRPLMEKLHEAIRALAEEREKNLKLGNSCRLLIAEREAWKHRAQAAEARIEIEEDNAASQRRLDALCNSPPLEAQPDTKMLSPPKPFSKKLLPDLARR